MPSSPSSWRSFLAVLGKIQNSVGLFNQIFLTSGEIIARSPLHLFHLETYCLIYLRHDCCRPNWYLHWTEVIVRPMNIYTMQLSTPACITYRKNLYRYVFTYIGPMNPNNTFQLVKKILIVTNSIKNKTNHRLCIEYIVDIYRDQVIGSEGLLNSSF